MLFSRRGGDREKMKDVIENGLKVSKWEKMVGKMDRTENFGQGRLWRKYPQLAIRMQRFIDTNRKTHLEKLECLIEFLVKEYKKLHKRE